MRALLVTPVLLAAFCLGGADAVAQGADALSSEINELRAQRAQINTVLRALNGVNKSIAIKQGEIDSTQKSMGTLVAEQNRARAQLKRFRDIEDQNPEVIQPEKMRAAEDENRQASRRVSEAKAKIGALELQLIELRSTQNRRGVELEQQRAPYEARIDSITDRQLAERIRGMQVKRAVEATGTASCEEVKLSECRQLSQKNAELKASEQGSVVVVESLTEIKNFKLTKEELRSVVSASLSDIRILEQKLIDETRYRTRISASVTPAVGGAFRQQLRASVRSEIVARLGGELDGGTSVATAAPVAAPADAADAAADDATARREEQRRLAQQRKLDEEKRQLDVERQQLAERRRREEAERVEQERRDREAAEASARRRRGTYTPTF